MSNDKPPEDPKQTGHPLTMEEEAYVFNLPNFAQDVVDFHVKYRIQYDGPVRRLPPDLFEFRFKRGLEEVYEYRDAANLEKELDAQIDEIYIALGTLHLHGFTPEAITEAWRRVHAANMKKELCSAAYPGKGHPTDIVKPKGWVPPDLSDLCGEIKEEQK